METVTAEVTAPKPTPLRSPESPLVSGKSTDYNEDFFLWVEYQAKLLREGSWQQLDIPNLLEEVEDMEISQKHATVSNLVVLHHLLKYRFQPRRRSRSWRLGIFEHRTRVIALIEDSSSLLRHVQAEFERTCKHSRKLASVETGLKLSRFPEQCPWSLEQVLDAEFLPE